MLGCSERVGNRSSRVWADLGERDSLALVGARIFLDAGHNHFYSRPACTHPDNPRILRCRPDTNTRAWPSCHSARLPLRRRDCFLCLRHVPLDHLAAIDLMSVWERSLSLLAWSYSGLASCRSRYQLLYFMRNGGICWLVRLIVATFGTRLLAVWLAGKADADRFAQLESQPNDHRRSSQRNWILPLSILGGLSVFRAFLQLRSFLKLLDRLSGLQSIARMAPK